MNVQVDKGRHYDRETFFNDRILFNGGNLNVVEISHACGWIDKYTEYWLGMLELRKLKN